MRRSFRYTILTVNLIRRYASARHSVASIARLVGCEPSTVETICRKHDIDLLGGAVPPVAPSHDLPPACLLDPMLNPGRRRARNNLTGIKLEIASGALCVIEREAARRGTTPAILIARMSELIARDDIFAAVLD